MQKRVNFPFLFLVYVILYLFHLKISLIKGSDDSWFADASNNTPYFEWIQMRYTTWSGRLLPDTMLYVLLDEYFWVWRILNPFFLMVLAFSLVRILKKDVSRGEFILGLVVLGYLSNNVLNSGFFWVTGSINYLWPIALGFTAMIPFASKVFDHNFTFSIKKLSVFILAGLLAAISNEQVALCMSAFSVVSLIVIFLKQKRIDKRFLLFTVFIIAGSSILLFAPGNKLRWLSEVGTWFPEYAQFTLKTKLHLGFIWLYKQLFIEMRNLIFLLSFAIIFVYFKGNVKRNALFYVFSVLVFIAVSTVFLGENMNEFYNFDRMKEYRLSQSLLHFWQIDWGFVAAIFPYLFWTIYSMLLSYLVLMISKHKFFIFLYLAAALSTLIIIFFSPTIYASGTRTLVVGSVLLSAVILNSILEHDLLKNRFGMILFSCLPLLNLWQLFVSW